MSDKKAPLVSIVTVCLNSEKLLRRTFQSIINQSYQGIEYVIVDGYSDDNTVNLIKEYEPLFKKVKWISEKDTGIYNAFNKGLDMSSGDIIYFLNAGDYLIDEEIITKVASIFIRKDIDILYGDIKTGNEGYRNNNVKSLFQLLFRTICHQAVFAKKECFAHHRFNEYFRWLSDYEWMIKCFKRKNIKKYYYNQIVCNFNPDNNTGLDDFSLLKERYRERMIIGQSNFSGLYKTIFTVNQMRLNLKLSILGALKNG